MNEKQLAAVKHYMDVRIAFLINQELGRPQNYEISTLERFERDFDKVMLGEVNDA